MPRGDAVGAWKTLAAIDYVACYSDGAIETNGHGSQQYVTIDHVRYEHDDSSSRSCCARAHFARSQSQS